MKSVVICQGNCFVVVDESQWLKIKETQEGVDPTLYQFNGRIPGVVGNDNERTYVRCVAANENSREYSRLWALADLKLHEPAPEPFL